MSKNALLSYLIHCCGAAAEAHRILACPPRPQYDGVLRTPMSIHIGHLLGKRPHWYPGDDEMWQRVSDLIRRRELGEWQQREQELPKIFGVPHAEVDLANPWCLIALRLAVEHVPGFRYPQREGDAIKRVGRGGNPKLTKKQIKALASLVAQALEEGKHEDKQIAAFICRGKNLGTIDKRGGPKPIGRSTSELYVKQMRTAWRAVCDGSATTLQYQAVEVALSQREVAYWGIVFSFKKDAAKGTQRSTDSRSIN
jgi:hypothetical protein